MKERPILFSAPMVQAILAGNKTQTRRVAKHPLLQTLSYIVNIGDGWFGDEEGDVQVLCPFGKVGDQLWVKETWRAALGWDRTKPREIDRSSPILFTADGKEINGDAWDDWESMDYGKLRPSIFMPRWASRIQLEITDVRVEHLQDISEADAQVEGADCLVWSGIQGTAADLIDWPLKEVGNPYRNGYALLWEAINGDGSWKANPWVWVIEFKRIDAAISAREGA